MREGLGIGDVVDGNELNVAVINRSTHDVAPDAAEAVDTYLDGHSSSGGVWDCGRASQTNFSHAAKLKMLWAAPTKVNAAHDCCRCKMRMSGLCKVEMSGFMGPRRRHGNGAHPDSSTRT